MPSKYFKQMQHPDPYFSVPSVIAPAPWELSGSGYVFLFTNSRSFLTKHAFMSPYQEANLKSGIGAVMLVDYLSSPVGPYRELLYIPGVFKLSGHYVFSISKIYVSSMNSQWNGVENWGIPKEVADFAIEQVNEKEEEWTVSRNNKAFFSASMSKGGLKFPVSTSLFPLRIGQQQKDSLLITEPAAKGKGQLIKSTHWHADPHFFPSCEDSTFLLSLAINDFKMTFPPARTFPV